MPSWSDFRIYFFVLIPQNVGLDWSAKSLVLSDSDLVPFQTAMKKAVRQQRACLVHWDICLLMLSACGSLERRLLEYLKLLSPWQQLQLEQLEALKLNANLRESLSEMARLCIDYLKVAKLQPPPWDKIFNVAKVR